MKRSRNRSIRFLASALALSIPALVLYSILLPSYHKCVVHIAAFCLWLTPTAPQIHLGQNGLWGVSQQAGGSAMALAGPRYSEGVFLAAAILPALLLATPWGWRRGMAAVSFAAFSLLAFHVTSIIILAWAGSYICTPPGGIACSYLKGAFIYANQTVPFILWLGLSWKVWFPTV